MPVPNSLSHLLIVRVGSVPGTGDGRSLPPGQEVIGQHKGVWGGEGGGDVMGFPCY